MEKDFDAWNTTKKDIHKYAGAPFYREREVWWCVLGTNIGFEQDGGENFLRPVVVVKKFSGSTCWCIPMTKRKKSGYHYTNVLFDGARRTVILSQLRLIDTRRLHHKAGILLENDFKLITKKLTKFLP